MGQRDYIGGSDPNNVNRWAGGFGGPDGEFDGGFELRGRGAGPRAGWMIPSAVAAALKLCEKLVSQGRLGPKNLKHPQAQFRPRRRLTRLRWK
jgi:hypothetical protein